MDLAPTVALYSLEHRTVVVKSIHFLMADKGISFLIAPPQQSKYQEIESASQVASAVLQSILTTTKCNIWKEPSLYYISLWTMPTMWWVCSCWTIVQCGKEQQSPKLSIRGTSLLWIDLLQYLLGNRLPNNCKIDTTSRKGRMLSAIASSTTVYWITYWLFWKTRFGPSKCKTLRRLPPFFGKLSEILPEATEPSNYLLTRSEYMDRRFRISSWATVVNQGYEDRDHANGCTDSMDDCYYIKLGYHLDVLGFCNNFHDTINAAWGESAPSSTETLRHEPGAETVFQ